MSSFADTVIENRNYRSLCSENRQAYTSGCEFFDGLKLFRHSRINWNNVNIAIVAIC